MADSYLASYREIFRQIGQLGFTGELTELGPKDAVDLEPSLAERKIAGGVHARVDRYVRPESLTAGLAESLRSRGVALQTDVTVTGIEQLGDGVRILTAGGPLETDRAVVAAGPSSPALLRGLGVDLPLAGARGYSLTIPGEGARPRHALYLADAKAGISSYDQSVRIAGVFELGQPKATLDRARLDGMVTQCEQYFESWRPSLEPRLLEWAGLRPMSADGLPLIGRSPRLPGVFVATGHGMLGVTLAPATAALLAPYVLDGVEASELRPFRPGRRIS
jgi:D-amino-acid dehydrogenase